MTADTRPLILHVIHHLVVGGMENGLVNLINRMPQGCLRHAVACIEDYSDFRQRITRADTEVIALHRAKIGVWKLRNELLQLCRRLRCSSTKQRSRAQPSRRATNAFDEIAPSHCLPQSKKRI